EPAAAPVTAWLPHLDFSVARAFTAGSATHNQLWEYLKKPGRLTLRSQLDLGQMLRPAVQPGSKIDHQRPPEELALGVRSAGVLQVNGPVAPARTEFDKDGTRLVRLTLKPTPGKWVPLEVALATGPNAGLSITWHTNEDPRPRALLVHRFLLP